MSTSQQPMQISVEDSIGDEDQLLTVDLHTSTTVVINFPLARGRQIHHRPPMTRLRRTDRLAAASIQFNFFSKLTTMRPLSAAPDRGHHRIRIQVVVTDPYALLRSRAMRDPASSMQHIGLNTTFQAHHGFGQLY